jgi:hypothetical protein
MRRPTPADANDASASAPATAVLRGHPIANPTFRYREPDVHATSHRPSHRQPHPRCSAPSTAGSRTARPGCVWPRSKQPHIDRPFLNPTVRCTNPTVGTDNPTLDAPPHRSYRRRPHARRSPHRRCVSRTHAPVPGPHHRCSPASTVATPNARSMQGPVDDAINERTVPVRHPDGEDLPERSPRTASQTLCRLRGGRSAGVTPATWGRLRAGRCAGVPPAGVTASRAVTRAAES